MYTAFLTSRYLRRRISALPTLLAVIFGVATLFTVFSVFEGYRVKVRELIRGQESHLTLLGVPSLSLTGTEEKEQVIRTVPHVVATAPFVETIVLYRSAGRFRHLHLRGIDPLSEAGIGDLEMHLLRPEELERILPLAQNEPILRAELDRRVTATLPETRSPLESGEIDCLFSRERRLEVLKATKPDRDPGAELPGAMVVGLNLLLDREVFLGDEVKVIALSPHTGKPHTESFVVTGASKSGDFDADSRNALVLRTRMQNFLGLWDDRAQDYRAEGIRIALDDYRHADRARMHIVQALAEALVGVKLPALKEMVRSVPSALSGERVEALSGELSAEIARLGGQVPPEEVREEVRRAAEALAAPRLAEEVGPRVEQTYREEVDRWVKKGGISEEVILWMVLRAAGDAWEAALLPDRKPPGEGSGPLRRAARFKVLEAARKELEVRAPQVLSGPLLVAELRTWEESNKQVLIEAVEREKWIIGFLVLLINAFIGCIVLLMLVLLVIEKTRDIGILVALGATTRGVVSIYLACGLLIVSVGVLLGLGAGYLFVRFLNPLHDAIYSATGYRLFDPETYKMDRLPTSVTADEVVMSIIPCLLFGLLASLIPAVWAARKDPIKAIHYE